MTRVKPILMSGPMVKATWGGFKTETRRMAWGDKPYERMSPWQTLEPGDLLWVRENFRAPAVWDSVSPIGLPKAEPIWYEAIDDQDRPGSPGKLRVGRYMCRWMSRLMLVVTSVKVQPIKFITHDGAYREGIQEFASRDGETFYSPDTMSSIREPNAYSAFASLWISLHGHDAWNFNPEVVVIRFVAHKINVDTFLGLRDGAPQMPQDARRSVPG